MIIKYMFFGIRCLYSLIFACARNLIAEKCVDMLLRYVDYVQPGQSQRERKKQERNGGSVDDKKQQQQQREKKVLQSKYATKTSSLRVRTPCRNEKEDPNKTLDGGRKQKTESDGRFLLFLGNDRRVM